MKYDVKEAVFPDYMRRNRKKYQTNNRRVGLRIREDLYRVYEEKCQDKYDSFNHFLKTIMDEAILSLKKKPGIKNFGFLTNKDSIGAACVHKDCIFSKEYELTLTEYYSASLLKEIDVKGASSMNPSFSLVGYLQWLVAKVLSEEAGTTAPVCDYSTYESLKYREVVVYMDKQLYEDSPVGGLLTAEKLEELIALHIQKLQDEPVVRTDMFPYLTIKSTEAIKNYNVKYICRRYRILKETELKLIQLYNDACRNALSNNQRDVDVHFYMQRYLQWLAADFLSGSPE